MEARTRRRQTKMGQTRAFREVPGGDGGIIVGATKNNNQPRGENKEKPEV